MQQITKYLKEPTTNPIPPGKESRHFTYLLTYLGELFVQGYRILENYGSLLLFSLMEFQFSDSLQSKGKRFQQKIPPRFKILSLHMSLQDIFRDGEMRRERFSQMLVIGNLLEEVQYNIVYLRQLRYSIMTHEMLLVNAIPHAYQYFKKNDWIKQKQGRKRLNFKDQGKQLHTLVQIFIKGAGQAKNEKVMKYMQQKHKFRYNLFNVINSVCYFIGKEFIQNDYQTISSQKWMRKYSRKNFRRYDLLMRNEHKSLIIDWKFSMINASQMITVPKMAKKCQLYCQLARKDFKNEVNLRIYCLHQDIFNKCYHQFTSKQFQEKISTINIEENDSQICISDSDDQIIADLQRDEEIQNILPIIEISSQDEQCQIIQSQNRLKQNESIKNCQAQIKHLTKKKCSKIHKKQFQMLNSQNPPLITNKCLLKTEKLIQKRRESLVKFPIQVFEIQSD